MAIQHITTRELIDANRKAIAERKLGGIVAIERGIELKECLYDFADVGLSGCGCGIGCAMNAEALARTRKVNLNGAAVGALVEAEILSFEDQGIAVLIQSAHDNMSSLRPVETASLENLWCVAVSAPAAPAIQRWIGRRGGNVDVAFYKALLGQIEHACCA